MKRLGLEAEEGLGKQLSSPTPAHKQARSLCGQPLQAGMLEPPHPPRGKGCTTGQDPLDG